MNDLSAGARIAQILRRFRFPLDDEKRLQAQIAVVLKDHSIGFEREVILSRKDRIDFLCEGGAGIEVKLRSPKLELYRQCRRYCEHARLTELVLATNVPTGWPPDINGKPQFFVDLARAWAR